MGGARLWTDCICRGTRVDQNVELGLRRALTAKRLALQEEVTLVPPPKPVCWETKEWRGEKGQIERKEKAEVLGG